MLKFRLEVIVIRSRPPTSMRTSFHVMVGYWTSTTTIAWWVCVLNRTTTFNIVCCIERNKPVQHSSCCTGFALEGTAEAVVMIYPEINRSQLSFGVARDNDNKTGHGLQIS